MTSRECCCNCSAPSSDGFVTGCVFQEASLPTHHVRPDTSWAKPSAAMHVHTQHQIAAGCRVQNRRPGRCPCHTTSCTHTPVVSSVPACCSWHSMHTSMWHQSPAVSRSLDKLEPQTHAALGQCRCLNHSGHCANAVTPLPPEASTMVGRQQVARTLSTSCWSTSYLLAAARRKMSPNGRVRCHTHYAQQHSGSQAAAAQLPVQGCRAVFAAIAHHAHP